MKYDLSCNVARKSPVRARSMATPRKWELPLSGLVGVLVSMAVGMHDGANGAHAQGAQNRQAIRQACEADYRSLCSGVQPGGGRILACLQQNAAKLSPPCHTAMAGVRKPQ